MRQDTRRGMRAAGRALEKATAALLGGASDEVYVDELIAGAKEMGVL